MLYICATPIGNLQDITYRAIEILRSSDIILCEDKRVSQVLLNHHGIIDRKLVAFHEHNENEVANKVLTWLNDGQVITQISDAGTPSISDPGARLCNVVRAHGYMVVPIPGACAYTTLLSVSGLNVASLFYGFLPPKKMQRMIVLKSFIDTKFAICIYESPHRIIDTLEDIIECLGEQQVITMGRELTKKFETIKKLSAEAMLEFIRSDSNQQRGEFVLILEPAPKCLEEDKTLSQDEINLLKILRPQLPPKRVVEVVSEMYGGNKKYLYQYLIKTNV
ncbi:MAG: 16S rRNA (cytidine(1402)-2'-O)-methyltransferase [Bacteroidia bacterium]|nr:MAG: 16S rRNA (cytidine(1402)-2'-O)-methyltransferase [Bacteroidia bacterium]